MDLYKYENELYEQGIEYVGGVDEVGRGPLIGPVVTACVVLPKGFILEGLTDSKKLSEKKRDLFYDYIINNCVSYAIGIVDALEIDEINIYEATKEAMIEAINNCKKKPVLSDSFPCRSLSLHQTYLKLYRYNLHEKKVQQYVRDRPTPLLFLLCQNTANR